jgi:hypothetical protein
MMDEMLSRVWNCVVHFIKDRHSNGKKIENACIDFEVVLPYVNGISRTNILSDLFTCKF